ncbi:MAG: type II toxin-antitoxin system VapC family toxin [Vulcanimicrobiota bacterium]
MDDTFGIISTIIDYQVISWYTYYMKKPALYIETTIAGYVTGKKSKDVVIRAHQHITLLWWKNFRQNYALFTSDVVVSESGRGDPYAAKKRLAFLQKIPRLRFEEEIEILAKHYAEKLNFPPKAEIDALHLAFSVYYSMDYLLTWNCTHLANEFFQRRLVALNNTMSLKTPLIVTPETLVLSEEEDIS